MGYVEDKITVDRLQGELLAAGVRFDGVDSNGNVSGVNPEDIELAALVVAARGQAINSQECQAVKQFLGASSPEWDAYQAVRQSVVEKQRDEAYRTIGLTSFVVKMIHQATKSNDGSGKKLILKNEDLDEFESMVLSVHNQYPDAT